MQDSKLKSESVDSLFNAILKLENLDEAYSFFEDLLTINEITSISQRFQVAQMLTKNHTYNQIEEETGASTATISRVKRSLNYGSNGLKKILDRMD